MRRCLSLTALAVLIAFSGPPLAGCGTDSSSEPTGADSADGNAPDAAFDATPDITVDGPSDIRADQVPDIRADQAGNPGVDADDAGSDAARDTTDEAIEEVAEDSTGSVDVAATPGARCALADRVGEIRLMDEGGGLSLSAELYDRKHPWYGAPELSTDVCDFHRFNPGGFCPPCGAGELCSVDGVCTPAPALMSAVTVIVSAGADEQVFTDDPPGQLVWGQLDLAGGAFALEVRAGGHTITLAETPVPGPLEQLSGTMTGSYDAPDAVDIEWKPIASPSHVFTHIPINHHASGPTFTECAAEASAGSLHVDGDMLVPLSVVTGLEFQGVEHLRFAAADTPLGCIEIRIGRHIYLSVE